MAADVTNAAKPNPAVPQPAAARPKSRRLWYILSFVLLLLATPVALYMISDWLGGREMEQLYAELDAADPGWRWPDLLANIPEVPDSENSAHQIAKVHVLRNRPAAFNPGSKWDNAELVQNARLTDEQVQALNAAFDRCDPTLREEARKMKDLPRAKFKIPVEGNPFELDFEQFQQSRGLVYVLQCDAALRTQEMDGDGAAESCQAILNTSGAFSRHPFLIGYLVRVAEQAIAIHAIERTLGQGPVSDANLKKLQDMLQREADDDGLLEAIRGERAAAHQMFVNVRDGKTRVSGVFGNMGPKGTAPSIGERVVDAFPGVLLRDYPDFLREMNRRVETCKLEGSARNDALQQQDQELRTKGNRLTKLVFPALSKVSNASLRSQTNLRCAVVAVAAERYRLRKEAWPTTLEDLVREGLVSKVPSDPYDDKPLRYRRTPTGVIIYSVGPDKTDNAGNIRANPMATGADYGFELWDPRMRGFAPPIIDAEK